MNFIETGWRTLLQGWTHVLRYLSDAHSSCSFFYCEVFVASLNTMNIVFGHNLTRAFDSLLFPCVWDTDKDDMGLVGCVCTKTGRVVWFIEVAMRCHSLFDSTKRADALSRTWTIEAVIKSIACELTGWWWDSHMSGLFEQCCVQSSKWLVSLWDKKQTNTCGTQVLLVVFWLWPSYEFRNTCFTPCCALVSSDHVWSSQVCWQSVDLAEQCSINLTPNRARCWVVENRFKSHVG